MTRYELYIDCRFCREEKHENCSSRIGLENDSTDNVVLLRCTCSYCKEKRPANLGRIKQKQEQSESTEIAKGANV